MIKTNRTHRRLPVFSIPSPPVPPPSCTTLFLPSLTNFRSSFVIYLFNLLIPLSVTIMRMSYWNMGCVSEALYLKIILPNLI